MNTEQNTGGKTNTIPPPPPYPRRYTRPDGSHVLCFVCTETTYITQLHAFSINMYTKYTGGIQVKHVSLQPEVRNNRTPCQLASRCAVSTAARVYILVYVVNNARPFDFCSSIYSVNFLIGILEYRYYIFTKMMLNLHNLQI